MNIEPWLLGLIITLAWFAGLIVGGYTVYRIAIGAINRSVGKGLNL